MTRTRILKYDQKAKNQISQRRSNVSKLFVYSTEDIYWGVEGKAPLWKGLSFTDSLTQEVRNALFDGLDRSYIICHLLRSYGSLSLAHSLSLCLSVSLSLPLCLTLSSRVRDSKQEFASGNFCYFDNRTWPRDYQSILTRKFTMFIIYKHREYNTKRDYKTKGGSEEEKATSDWVANRDILPIEERRHSHRIISLF